MVDRIHHPNRNASRFAVLRSLSGSVFVILILLGSVSPLRAQDASYAGEHWRLSPRIIELPEGGLVDPAHPGAAGLRGFEEIEFLRPDMAVLSAAGTQMSAFFSQEEGEDGTSWIFSFGDGRMLSVSIGKASEDRYLFLYRIPEDFFHPPSLMRPLKWKCQNLLPAAKLLRGMVRKSRNFPIRKWTKKWSPKKPLWKFLRCS